MSPPPHQTNEAKRLPFGAFAPSPFQEKVRSTARALPRNWIGRKLASALLGPAGGRSDRAFDVMVFDTERARLHPSDNICEKRVYLTPHFWDAEERQHLAAVIAAHERETFYFLDIGANVGLYTLFARSAARAAGKTLSAACVEPAEEMRRRLNDNLALSNVEDGVQVLPFAVTAENGPASFSIDEKSRGMSRISKNGKGDEVVEGRTLETVIGETGFDHIDVMKIDIEGHEAEALEPFYQNAPTAPRPRHIIIEKSHTSAAHNILLDAGYLVVFENALNGFYKRVST